VIIDRAPDRLAALKQYSAISAPQVSRFVQARKQIEANLWISLAAGTSFEEGTSVYDRSASCTVLKSIFPHPDRVPR
jgi:hypothetical protein